MMMKCYVAFGLFFSITMTVQSQLTVTWQGETVTGPLLIFHSEIQQTVNSNSLTCSHPTGSVAWYLPNGNILHNSGGAFNNIITNGGRQTQIMRGTYNNDDRGLDGLWTCRLNGAGAGAFPVGIYDDSPSTTNGAITNMQGRSNPFTTNPISFQLFGDSTGGPPTTSYWTRNNVNITNNSTFIVSISFTGPFNTAGYRAANYQSTLTVTSDQPQPGTYLYRVSNRRTTGIRTVQVLVDGNPPSGLTLSRVSLDRVRVTWTEPDIRPRGGYRIEVVSGNINITADMPPQEILLTPRSTPYEVTLVSLSRHYPINNIMSSITLIDLLVPTSTSMSSLTATSVTISWTQPGGSLTVDNYRVTLTTTSTGMCSGVSHTREETATSTSVMIDGLEENSIYTVTISAVNNEFNVVRRTSGLTITTLEAVPIGPPVIVMPHTVSSRSITVNWNEIPCIQRNGRIFRYEVEFGPSGEGTISGRSFTANGLTPFTNYTFQVHGVTSVGPGPYSDLITITTSEEAPGPVSSLLGTSTLATVVLTWSPPQQPNGIITQYTVTYRVNGSAPITRNTDDPVAMYTVPSLFPQTTISDISVRASTSAGPGPEVTLEDVVTLTRPSEVMGVDVEILTDTSVRVSWERILNIPELTHYTVFYSRAGSRKRQADCEQFRNVPSSTSSVDIEGLVGGARSYQFVVVAVATVDNVEFPGERPANPFTFPSSSSSSDEDSVDVSIAVVVTFLLTIILYTIVLLVTCYIYRVCYVNRTKSIIKQTEQGNTEVTYEVITTKVDSHDFAMKECAAYGPVSSTQAQYEVMSSPQAEGAYESV